MRNKIFVAGLLLWACSLGAAGIPPIPQSAKVKCDILRQHEVKLVVSSDQGYLLNGATIDASPSTCHSATAMYFHGEPLGKGEYSVVIPKSYPCSDFLLKISHPDYEMYGININTTFTTAPLAATLVYNNYYKKYTIQTPNALIETFGDLVAKLDQSYAYGKPRSDTVKIPFAIPFLQSSFLRESPSISPIYVNQMDIPAFEVRRQLYKCLGKELVLQTSIKRSALYAEPLIAGWIEQQQGTTLGSVSSKEIAKLSTDLGQGFAEKYNNLSRMLKGAGIILSLSQASDKGTIKALLLVVAYQQFQAECCALLVQKASTSDLWQDNSLSLAMADLKVDLVKEQQEDLVQLVDKYKSNEMGVEAAGILLSEGLSTMLGVAGKMYKFGFWEAYIAASALQDIAGGVNQHEKERQCMLFIAQFDKYLLSEFPDSFSPDLSTKVCSDPSIFYGGLMRMDAGHLFNLTRRNHFQGKDQGVILAGIAEAAASAFEKKMATVSQEKLLRDSADYLRLSAINPYPKPQESAPALVVNFEGSMRPPFPAAASLQYQAEALMQSSGYEEQAIKLLTKAIAIDPHPALFNDRCLAWESLRQFDRAIEDARVAVRLDRTANHLLVLARVLAGGKNFDEAIRTADQVCQARLASSDDCAVAYNSIGAVLGDDSQNVLAAQELEKAHALEPTDQTITQNLSIVYSAIGVTLAGQGDRNQAKKYFQKALQLSPGDATIRQNYKRMSE